MQIQIVNPVTIQLTASGFHSAGLDGGRANISLFIFRQADVLGNEPSAEELVAPNSVLPQPVHEVTFQLVGLDTDGSDIPVQLLGNQLAESTTYDLYGLWHWPNETSDCTIMRHTAVPTPSCASGAAWPPPPHLPKLLQQQRQ